MFKLLVTGGCGFIGSNFIKYMLNHYNDVEIVNYDKLTYAADIRRLDSISKNSNYSFIKGDICDLDMLEKVLKEKQISHVINFAAQTHVDKSIESPHEFFRTNTLGVGVLLEASCKIGVDKFIQISTDEVYGESKNGEIMTEESPLKPNNPYAASKASGDMIVRAYNKTYGIRTNITRSSNNFGSNQNKEKFIPLIIDNALKNKKIPIYGDGRQKRDWIYVTDNVRAIDIVLRKGKDNEIYNISSGNELENIDVVINILKNLGKSSKLISYVEDRKAHDRRYLIDSSKIKKLGWQKEIPFEDGIKKIIKGIIY